MGGKHKYRRDKDNGTRQRAGRRQRSFQMLEPRIMLAVDLPVDLLTGPDDPIALVTQAPEVAPADQPIRDLPAPTATEVDALFEADFDPQPGVLVEPGDPLDARGADHHFAEIEQLVPDDHQLVDRDSQPDNHANSVADFQWPATGLTAEVVTEPTAQEPPDQSAAGSSSTDRSANPIRGPPAAISAQNSFVDTAFLESGSSDPGLTGPAVPRQLVVIDPLLDDMTVLASGISGPDTDLLTLSADADPLSQIEAALGHSGQVSAIHIFSHGSAGQFTLSGLVIDRDLVSARADELARWSENLADDATLFLYGCDLAESAAGRQLADQLAGLTGARVAASSDPTGNPLLGGDWQLEYHTGRVALAGSMAFPKYRGLLKTITVAAGALGEIPTRIDDTYNFDVAWGTIDIKDGVRVGAESGGNDTFNFGAVPSHKPLVVTFGKGDKTLVAKQGTTNSVTADKAYAPKHVKGGKGNDVFSFQSGASLAKTLDGGPGDQDVLNFSGDSNSPTRSVIVSLAGKDGSKLVSDGFCTGAILEELKDNVTPSFEWDGKDGCTKVAQTPKLSATNIGGSTPENKISNIEFVIGTNTRPDSRRSGDVLIADTNADSSHEGARLVGAGGNDLLIGGNRKDLLIGGGEGSEDYIEAIRDVTNISDLRLTADERPPSTQVIEQLKKLWALKPPTAKDNDILFGNGHEDVLIGGKGDDHLIGGKDNDTLYGGPGDDTYYFEKGWGKDRIYDASGTDTLNFWMITTPITVEVEHIEASSTTPPKDVFTVTSSMSAADRLTKVEAIEKLVGTDLNAPGDYDTLLIKSLPKKSTMTFGDPDRAGQFHLDLHQIDQDLEVIIDKNDKKASNKVTVRIQDDKSDWIIVYGVSKLTGGKGNNTYKMKDGAEFPGQLIGGAPSIGNVEQQPVGYHNILDYS